MSTLDTKRGNLMKNRLIGICCSSIMILLLFVSCSAATTPASEEQSIVAQWSESLKSVDYIEEDLQAGSEKEETDYEWGDYIYRGYTVQPGLYFYTCSSSQGDILEVCAYCDTTLLDSQTTDYNGYEIYGYMSGILLATIDSENIELVVDALNLDDPDIFLQSHNDSYTANDIDYKLIYDITEGKMFFRATLQ